MTKSLELKVLIEIIGVNPYVLINSEQAASLQKGWRRPLPVLVHINGITDKQWQTNMMPNGKGDFYLYLHGEMRKASKTKVGDYVSVKITFDESYRNGPLHTVPDWFNKALDENTSALACWHDLSPSRQKEVLRYFDGLKSNEAKNRNLERIMHVLQGNKGHFMGRDWVNGK